ncbi:mediator of RNA polymerase II transcription subunit 25 [Acrasis kona]|uniref:Mediator of RNA polymerase II transcription subunit 25 n=1 Tax=Acrasis kona TaxID=1008807 RepID=A0AAW2Z5A5_9EUKA
MSQTPMSHRQICIVMDTSANLRTHFKALYQQYIEPILQQLSKTTTQNSQVEYGLVLFQDYPPYSEYLVRSVPFTTNRSEFVRNINEINFSGGGTSETAVSEGLTTCLIDLHWRNDNSEKYCILVCVKPHDVGCSLIGPCLNLMSSEIVRLMAKKNIALSLITLARNTKLDAIFDAGDIPKVPIYDEGKCVRLRGFQLNTSNVSNQSFAQLPTATIQNSNKINVPSHLPTVPNGNLSNVNPSLLKQPPLAPAAQPLKGKFGPMVWQGNLSVDANNSVHPVICKLSAFSMQQRVDKEKMFLSKWPTTITIKHQLPAFQKELIFAGMKQYQNTICLWFPSFQENDSDVKYDPNKYNTVIKKMEQSKLVAYFELSNDGPMKHYLALFPYALHHGSKNTGQPVPEPLQRSIMSVVIDSSMVKKAAPTKQPQQSTVQNPPGVLVQGAPSLTLTPSSVQGGLGQFPNTPGQVTPSSGNNRKLVTGPNIFPSGQVPTTLVPGIGYRPAIPLANLPVNGINPMVPQNRNNAKYIPQNNQIKK